MNTPVDFTRYKREEALDIAATGRPVEVVAKAYGADARTFWRHLAMDPVFKESWSRAREVAYFIIADSVLYIHEEFPEAGPKAWHVIGAHRQWYLSKLYPAVFGDKLTVQVEHVDLKGALTEARTRVITIVNNSTNTSDAPE